MDNEIEEVLARIKKYADEVHENPDSTQASNLTVCIKYMFHHTQPKEPDGPLSGPATDANFDQRATVDRVQVVTAISALIEQGIL